MSMTRGGRSDLRRLAAPLVAGAICATIAAAQAGAAVLEGSVRDVLGRPIASATVELVWPMVEARKRGTQSDATGRFVFGGVDLDMPVLIRARAPAFAGSELRWPPPLTGPDANLHPRALAITLRDAEKITGTVTDPAGKALAGVIVWAGPGAHALTDSDGRYELMAGVGPACIQAHIVNYRLARANLRVESASTRDFVLAPLPERLIPIGVVNAHDLERDAGPWMFEVTLPGATLHDALRWRSAPPDCKALIAALPTAVSTVHLHHAKRWDVASATTTFTSSRIELRVPPAADGAQTRGRVLDAAGNGVPDLTLIVGKQVRVVTDGTGRFVCALRPAPSPHHVDVAITSRDWVLAAPSPSGVLRDPNAGGRIFPRVTRAACLRGQVVGPDGEPVPRARLVLLPERAAAHYPEAGLATYTDAAGHFELGGLYPTNGNVLLIASSDTGAVAVPAAIPAPGESAKQELRLEPCATLSGRLVDGVTPLVAAPVRLRRVFAGNRPLPFVEVTTNRHGEFRCGSLPAGQYVLTLPPHYVFSRMLDLAPDEARELGELQAALR